MEAMRGFVAVGMEREGTQMGMVGWVEVTGWVRVMVRSD